MKKSAGSQKQPKQGWEKRVIASRKTIAKVAICLIILACLLACGYFGQMAIRRSQLRHAAMAAYAEKDYVTAERLLRQYVQKDRNGEHEFVALANIYHEFGNAGLEMQMWQSASSLDPLNAEYRDNLLTSAARSLSYGFLHGILARKAKLDERFTDQELYLFVISSYRASYPKDGDDAYKLYVDKDPDAFHRSELGYMAEFMATYSAFSEGERDVYLEKAMRSEDPVVRFEAVFIAANRMAQSGDDDDGEKEETLLKRLVEINGFAGTPFLADVYCSHFRFEDAVVAAEPYLEMIDAVDLYLLFAESCVFTGRLDRLKALAKELHRKSGSIRTIADYCDVLIVYMEDDMASLVSCVRKSGKLVFTPLSRFIRLRVALEQDSFNEILSIAEEIFSNPPFHDLHGRTLALCLDYLDRQMRKPENQDDPSEMAVLAKVLAGFLPENRLLSEIILADQYKRGTSRESDLLAALKLFPDDLLLLGLTAEYLVFNGKADPALTLVEQALENGQSDGKLDFLHMLALDQLGRYDEAEVIFRLLVERSEFDLDLLAQYFEFCRDHERRADMAAMAARLEDAGGDILKPFAGFFRAAALMLEDDDAKRQEALDLLAATPAVHPDFTFYAANMLSDAGRLGEAEAKYTAILKTHSNPSQILMNLSEVYKEKGETEKAFETAKEAYAIEKKSTLPAFIYAKRLSEAERYEEAVEVLNFPRHAVDYSADLVELWTGCMRNVIEKSIRDRKFLLAESQCRHLLLIVPDDEFGKEKLEEVREILFPKRDDAGGEE